MKSSQKTHKNLNQLLEKLATTRATELATTVQCLFVKINSSKEETESD